MVRYGNACLLSTRCHLLYSSGLTTNGSGAAPPRPLERFVGRVARSGRRLHAELDGMTFLIQHSPQYTRTSTWPNRANHIMLRARRTIANATAFQIQRRATRDPHLARTLQYDKHLLVVLRIVLAYRFAGLKDHKPRMHRHLLGWSPEKAHALLCAKIHRSDYRNAGVTVY